MALQNGVELSRSVRDASPADDEDPTSAWATGSPNANCSNPFREFLVRLNAIQFGEPDLLHSALVPGIERLGPRTRDDRGRRVIRLPADSADHQAQKPVRFPEALGFGGDGYRIDQSDQLDDIDVVADLVGVLGLLE